MNTEDPMNNILIKFMKSKDKERALNLQHDNIKHQRNGILSENSFNGTF